MTDQLPDNTPPEGEACPYCGALLVADSEACPACGAHIHETRPSQTDSGWNELAPLRDMARLQFDRSSVQIEGTYTPVAAFHLASDDQILFTHHVLLWKEPEVVVRNAQLGGWLKRWLGGLPLVMTEAAGPGGIALAREPPGELLAIPLDKGQSVLLRENLLVAASGGLHYDIHQTGVWYVIGSGKEQETIRPLGMYMERFTARDRPGLLLLHASGNAFERTLAEGEHLLIQPTSLIYSEPMLRMMLHFESPRGRSPEMSFKHRTVWLHVQGPGRIAVRSAYSRVPTHNIHRHSRASFTDW